MQIIALKNRLKNNPDPSVRRALQYLERITGQKFYVDYKDTQFLITTGMFKKHPGKFEKYWGLTHGASFISQLIPKNTYNIAVFLYEFPQELDKGIGWTGLPFPDKTIPVDIPLDDRWGVFWTESVFAHELGHAFFRMALSKGIQLTDTIDTYEKDINEKLEENLLKLAPYWDRLNESTPVVGLYKTLIASLTSLAGLLGKLLKRRTEAPETPPEPVLPTEPPPVPSEPEKPAESKLEIWGLAIREMEGWFEGSRSWRNQNPGNLKFVGQHGAAQDKDGFAIFKTYEQGWNTLKQMLKNAAIGRSRVYSPEDSLVEFFSKYAPASDNNKPLQYASFVAGRIGVDKNTKIKTLV